MASVNPILDPWIYILLRKTVLSKVIEKIKCLFCRIGGGRRPRSAGSFNCTDGRRASSVLSSHSPSFVSRELREISSTSQTLLYPLELSDGSFRNVLPGATMAINLPGAPDRTLRGSDQSVSSQSQDSEQVLLVNETRPARVTQNGNSPKGNVLHVTFPDETLNLSEKCI